MNKKRIIRSLITIFTLATISSFKSNSPKLEENFANELACLDERLETNLDILSEETYESFTNFYTFVYDVFGENLTKAQKQEIKNIMENDLRDDSLKSCLNRCLDLLFEGQNNALVKQCKKSILHSAFSSIDFSKKNNSNDFELLMILCDGDKRIIPILATQNTDKLLEFVSNKIGPKSDEIIKELFLALESENYIEESFRSPDFLLIDNKEHIQNLFKELIYLKSDNSEEFSNTVMADILKNASRISYDILRDNCSVYMKEEDIAISFTLPYDVLLTTDRGYFYSELAESTLKTEYNEQRDGMQLLSFIVDQDTLLSCVGLDNFEIMKKGFYKSLDSYFESQEDFDQFLILLCAKSENAMVYYMAILKDQLMQEYTIENNAYYKHFLTLCEENTEDEEIGNVIFKSHNVKDDLKELQRYFLSDENPYKFATDPYEDGWNYHEGILIMNPNTKVISNEFMPNVVEYNGGRIASYQIPAEYKDATPIRLFRNDLGIYSPRTINGIWIEEDDHYLLLVPLAEDEEKHSIRLKINLSQVVQKEYEKALVI